MDVVIVAIKSGHHINSIEHRPVHRLLEPSHLFVKGVEVHIC